MEEKIMDYNKVGKETPHETVNENKSVSYKMYATCAVNVRSIQSQTAEILGVLASGEAVEVVENQGEWCRVIYNGGEGCIMSEFLTENEAE